MLGKTFREGAGAGRPGVRKGLRSEWKESQRIVPVPSPFRCALASVHSPQTVTVPGTLEAYNMRKIRLFLACF